MAYTLELAINQLLKEIRFEDSLRKAVVNGMFTCGIVKCGLGPGYTVEVDGATHDAGQPFADVVDFDDWVHDTNAKTLEQSAFFGNKYRLPFEYVKESKLFNATDLKADSNYSYKQREEAAGISKPLDRNPDGEYMEYVDLWDVYVPYENVMVTYACNQSNLDALRIIEWDGPECGPYHFLGFGDVPNNIIPLAPVTQWIDLHDTANRIMRKLVRQAERQKTILGIRDGSAKDGEKIVAANDGDTIRMENPDGAKEYSFGGIHQPSLAYLIQIKDLFSWMGGNLDSLGGLSPMSTTYKQDKLLSETASKRVADMQDKTSSFVKEIVNHLAWYLWTDPLINMPLTKRVPGTDIEVPINFTPEDREGDFLDYNFDIQPYSLQEHTPADKMNSLMQLMTQVLIPMSQQMQAGGVGINFPGFLKTIRNLGNLPEVEDLLTFQQPQQMEEGQPVGEPPQKSPVTTRTYERVNRPGATRVGKDYAMMQTLLGGNAQPKEAEAALRPVG
jgi:hypothetical protein